ncbi:unnamed protein product [Adineta ricciae]|uniref:AIG1-type G domain-containing protein n=1 Tax=Adineta ricciae TaxID=249248 RepID=A0A815CWN4_ADIRI|nr:unnamed protein product [Adineta ricciae]
MSHKKNIVVNTMADARAKHTSNCRVVQTPITYNILLAGETGTGKSAVINMIFDEDRVETSSGAIGCTRDCSSVRGTLKEYPHMNLRMVDTVGLGESLEGEVPNEQAMNIFQNKIDSLYSKDGIHLLLYCIRKGRQLTPTIEHYQTIVHDLLPNEQAMNIFQNKIDSLYSKDGIHLILYCIRKGRQLTPTIEHYQTIVHDLCEKQVPCLLVITRCEGDSPTGRWWKENEVYLRKNLKFDVDDAVAVTAVKTDASLSEYNESRKQLIEAIRQYALKEPWRSKNLKEKLLSLYHSKVHRPSVKRQGTSDPLWKQLQEPMNTQSLTRSIWSWFSSSSRAVSCDEDQNEKN